MLQMTLRSKYSLLLLCFVSWNLTWSAPERRIKSSVLLTEILRGVSTNPRLSLLLQISSKEVTFSPAAPRIKPSDLRELITKVCLGLDSLCCSCNYIVLSLSTEEAKVGERDHYTPQWNNSAVGERTASAGRGGGLKLDPSLFCLWPPLHLHAASERDLRMTGVFHTGTFRVLGPDGAFVLSLKHTWLPTHVFLNMANMQNLTHMHAVFLPTQQHKARIMMTGGGVIPLSSVVFTLVICK